MNQNQHEDVPPYNLWEEAWIGLERPDGSVEKAGIGQALACADAYRGLHDPSPLVVVGIHRLLVAILQAALHPIRNRDLEMLWEQGRFPEAAVVDFAARYSGRFSLFSPDAPFLQSADLGLVPAKADRLKTVAYLMPDIPAGTAVTHYRHGAEDSHRFCPACSASGLVVAPAFASSGGAGIKPSINGVPPIYVLPGGDNLFQSLAASLLTPGFAPQLAPGMNDLPWWEREARVPRSSEVGVVGYLHGLTFAARRVRLHPVKENAACTRCGAVSEWGVRTMVYEMGESQVDDAPFWRDPFAAFRMPEKSKAGDRPTPIRPIEGRAAWREYGGLFLQRADGEDGSSKKRSTLRPYVLDQISALFADYPDTSGSQVHTRSFRCVGMRTDMKAKVFEWVDSEFDVPMRLLRHRESAGDAVDRAITLAGDCGGILSSVFKESFNANARKSDRDARLRINMINQYWTALAEPFRQLVLTLDPLDPTPSLSAWANNVLRTARSVFHATMELLPDDAANLRRRETAEQKCAAYLITRVRKENLDE